ncbi:MAG: hypothetical protein ACLQNE_21290, partial [Thermoguttaceae bacterium]
PENGCAWAQSACEPIHRADADFARWQRAMWSLALAVNLIHHPDEPDGLETRDAATTATMTGDYPRDRVSK